MDKIAGNYDEVGVELQKEAGCPVDKFPANLVSPMDVTHHADAETRKLLAEPSNGDFTMDYLKPKWLPIRLDKRCADQS